jgi:thiamine biosynthesis lipoprotein
MDTLVTVQVALPPEGAGPDLEARVQRALGWFAYVEQVCSRFDAQSEVQGLLAHVRELVPISPVLCAALQLALAVARRSRGAFDPTLGLVQEQRGFARDYRTGQLVRTLDVPAAPVDYRSVRLDPRRRTVTLMKPLLLDLGGVAKGLALDLAARELAGMAGFAVEAGGDLCVAGCNAQGGPWRVGLRDPREPAAVGAILQLSAGAVCTSGGYARVGGGAAGEHHLLDPRTGRSPRAALSATVLAPSAMLADALATAALVLGPRRGLRLLHEEGVEGTITGADLVAHSTPGFGSYLCGGPCPGAP